jgi:hypothetical protein
MEYILKEYIFYNLIMYIIVFPILFIIEYLYILLFWNDSTLSVPYLLFGLIVYFPMFFPASLSISIFLGVRGRKVWAGIHNLSYFITSLFGGLVFCTIYGLILWGIEPYNWPKSVLELRREYEVLITFIGLYISVRFLVDKWRLKQGRSHSAS